MDAAIKVDGGHVLFLRWCIENEKVGVPLVFGRGDGAVGAGERDDGGDRLGLGVFGFAAQHAGLVEGGKRALVLPINTVPEHPTIPLRDVAEVLGVTVGEL